MLPGMRTPLILLAAILAAPPDACGQVTIVLDASPMAQPADGEPLTGAVAATQLRDGEADFADPQSHIDFGPDPRLGRDHRASFTLECSLRTGKGDFCTPLMCRDGDRVCYSLVVGRRPGTVSFEVWSWTRDKAISQSRIDDGEWHRLQATFDAASNMLALLVDGRLEALVPVTATATAPPQPTLRLGNNIGTHQPYAGRLRDVRLSDDVPDAVRDAIAERRQWAVLDAADVRDHIEDWLVRHRTARPPRAATAGEWQTKARDIRSRLQDALGLWPPPYATEAALAAAGTPPVTDFARARPQLDLDVREGGSLDRDGYRLTRTYWQTIRGYWAGGWLYRPTGRDGKRAAVLCPHGHWQDGARHPVVQARCMTLAKNGYVVLAVDSVHVYDDPIGLVPLSLMTWNNLRGLELLRSLPEVDAARIGCTGASGGGQQTFYLTGLESGLAAAAPAVMVCHFDEILLSSGVHCACNFTPGLMTFADEPELSAAFAPKPQLFLSVTGDWTHAFPRRGFPEIRDIYALFGADARVTSQQWQSEHDYNRSMRNVMYAFFARELNGEAQPDEALEPEGLVTETLATLNALERADVPHALEPVQREFRARLTAPADSGVDAVRDRLQRRLLATMPAPRTPLVTPVRAVRWRQYEGRAYRVAVEPEIDLPLVVLSAGASPAPVALAVGERGKSELLQQHADWIEGLLREGWAVALADVRYTGEWDVAQAWRDPYGKIFGRDEGVLAVQDMIRLRDALDDIDAVDASKSVLLAFGDRGAPALYAAALDQRWRALVAPELGPSYARSERRPKLTGVLRAGDLADAARLLAPRPAWLGGADFGAPATAGLAPDSVLTGLRALR